MAGWRSRVCYLHACDQEQGNSATANLTIPGSGLRSRLCPHEGRTGQKVRIIMSNHLPSRTNASGGTRILLKCFRATYNNISVDRSSGPAASTHNQS